MTTKVVIFDFDGTIGDTVDVIVNITNRLALKYGYKQTTQVELARLKHLSSKEIVQHSGISIVKLPFLIKKVRSELSREILRIKPIPGIKEALLELNAQGNTLGILTSNSKENIIAFLEENELQEIFKFVYSGTTLFGKNKIINNLLKQQGIDREDAIYIGDETRDIEAARKSNIKAIAVGWGFNSPEVLAKQNPDFLVLQPQELTKVIASLTNLLTCASK